MYILEYDSSFWILFLNLDLIFSPTFFTLYKVVVVVTLCVFYPVTSLSLISTSFSSGRILCTEVLFKRGQSSCHGQCFFSFDVFNIFNISKLYVILKAKVIYFFVIVGFSKIYFKVGWVGGGHDD